MAPYSSDRSDHQFLVAESVNNRIYQQQQQQQQQTQQHAQAQAQGPQIQQYDQYGAPVTNAAPFSGGNYYTNPFYHRFVQSPAPFYLTGYTDSNGFMEIGDGWGGNNLMMVGNFAGQESGSPGNGATLLYDPIYGQQYAAYSFMPPSHQGYYDNNYSIGYTANPPLFDDHQQQFQHHFRVNHQNGDYITPYSSELGINDNICGGSSSGGTGSSSPTQKELLLNNEDSLSTASSNSHVRPLDVITPELFQAIHAPTFYKSVINPQPQQVQNPNHPQPQAQFYFPFSEPLSGPNSVYGNALYPATTSSTVTSSNTPTHQVTYIPPINSISSMASAYQQPMKPNLNYPNNQYAPYLQKPPNQIRTVSTGGAYTVGSSKEILPSITGPDGLVYQKPPGSYASLITKALKECESGKMTLAGIYNWIKNNYPYYGSAEAAWQNSIRHNLSLNKCFKKVPRPSDEPGKGGFWALDYEYIRNHDMAKRMNNPHGFATDLENLGNECETVDTRTKVASTNTNTNSDSVKEQTSNSVYSSSAAAKKRRTTADLESSKLLDVFIPQSGWEDSVQAVASSVVDEVYAATFEQESLVNNQKEGDKLDEIKSSKRPRRTISSLTLSAQTPREPKPYSSMSRTLKIPTPILPNALSGSASGTASANRQLQYHQYQPATPLSSGTSSAK